MTSQSLTIINSHQCAALRTCLTDVSSLCVSWEHNPWILAYLFTFMDMAQCPVLISFGAQRIDRAWCIGLVTRFTIEAGV